MRILVVGAGVIGLTAAVRLLEAGHRVNVIARDLPLETTSVVAGALWYPIALTPSSASPPGRPARIRSLRSWRGVYVRRTDAGRRGIPALTR